MHKRLTPLALCLVAAAVLGTSACDSSGDSRANGPSAAPSGASAPAGAAPSASPSSSPAKVRTLTGIMSKLYVRSVRKNYPDVDHISDDSLITYGNAICVARSTSPDAFGKQAKKTMQDLGTTPTQTAHILGSADAFCR
ncbi:hypothetical protein [Streptomyces griseocarneus]|uniref:hypothetical protein n=1 Tax=Streptomyces griseocarneus TaxID=51201 RepID=UPI00167CDAAD|nr:hypothetical protein [Streptomyces griseocarneus]MBZ6472343.1 hypothetical protein [Streptomyces griseocarneus]GHG72507.1 hypothetical protein GCM10018779_47920 [Streptomyces griseocarneus]